MLRAFDAEVSELKGWQKDEKRLNRARARENAELLNSQAEAVFSTLGMPNTSEQLETTTASESEDGSDLGGAELPGPGPPAWSSRRPALRDVVQESVGKDWDGGVVPAKAFARPGDRGRRQRPKRPLWPEGKKREWLRAQEARGTAWDDPDTQPRGRPRSC